MVTIEEFIEVVRPVSVVYDQWTQFEEFPLFMRRVKQVEQIDDVRIHWKAQLGWKTKEWFTVIVEQVPDKKIVWRSVSGGVNFGRVEFTTIEQDSTRLTLRLNYEPEGVAEQVGDFLGLVSGGIERDLKRFKHFIESRALPTGRWRGVVQGGCIGQISHSLLAL
jgi:uncharacterized membrane protein